MTMTDEQIIELAKQITGWTTHFSIPQEPLGHFYDGHRHQASVEKIVRFARALLSASKPAAPAQSGEPVAWRIDPGAGSACDRFQSVEPYGWQYAEVSTRGGSITPLYAAPQPASGTDNG